MNVTRDVRQFALKALHAAGGEPMTDDALKAAIRAVFAHVAFTAGDLNAIVRGLETDHLITGTQDEVAGLLWALTPKGTLRAQQL